MKLLSRRKPLLFLLPQALALLLSHPPFPRANPRPTLVLVPQRLKSSPSTMNLQRLLHDLVPQGLPLVGSEDEKHIFGLALCFVILLLVFLISRLFLISCLSYIAVMDSHVLQSPFDI
jgi:hypothetical protein